MKPARLAVLAIALAAGTGAVFLMSGDPPPPPAPVAAAPAPVVQATEVLVAAAELPTGQKLQAADLRWQKWPDDAVSAGYLVRKDNPKALEEAVGATVRAGFLPGEPIRSQRLVRPEGGLMAAILQPGQRAVAIVTDSRGTNSAGGFILPNDRVDVILSKRDRNPDRAGAGGDVVNSEIILSNVRVLAIDQTIEEKNGQKVVVGKTATLELKPEQAEFLARSRQSGTLSLALRSLADANAAAPTEASGGRRDSVNVVRYGIPSQTTIPK